MIILDHPVKHYWSDSNIETVFALNGGTIVKFNTWCDRLDKLALDKYPNDTDKQHKFKGDSFEMLVEYFIKRCGQGDNRIAIRDYTIISETDIPDYGVDGFGRSTINGGPVTVQVKYRQANHILTQNEGRLGNFYQQSREDFFDLENPPFIPPTNKNANMLIITSAGDIHYSVREIWKGKVRCINRNGLRELTDNVPDFWESFRESIFHSRTKRAHTHKISLRSQQIEIVNAAIDTIKAGGVKGQIIAPCGVGKTYTQAEIIARTNEEFGFKYFVILSPRILLAFQLLRQVSSYLIKRGFDAEYLNINSGNFDEEIVNEERAKAGYEASQIQSTTNPNEIIKIARNCNKPLIISCTYHSAQRIKGLLNIDLQLNDEAHNMVADKFTDCHGIGKTEFSFTATQNITASDDGWGMNNPQLWGDITKEITPKTMIEAGEILPVRLHLIRLSPNEERIQEDDHNAYTRCIIAGFYEHDKELRRVSANPDLIAPKLLVKLPGLSSLTGMYECQEFKQFLTNSTTKIFIISSEFGSFVRDSESRTDEKCGHDPAGWQASQSCPGARPRGDPSHSPRRFSAGPASTDPGRQA